MVPHYQTSTNRILNDFVFRYLTSEEKRRLVGVSIDFPLEAGADEKGHPLAFYSPPGQPRVVFPIFSMKFLDDLSTAYAWLQVNGYVLDTISEYTAMLAYKDLGGRYRAAAGSSYSGGRRSGETRSYMSWRWIIL